MSGGSWDYVSNSFRDVADRLKSEKQIKRRLLGRLVEKISIALHDIEWVDSSDTSPGDEIKAIDACLKFSVTEELKSEVNGYIEELRKFVEDK